MKLSRFVLVVLCPILARAQLTNTATLDSPELDTSGKLDYYVEKMEGGWKVKNEGLMPRYEKARQLAAVLPGVRFAWIRRELNGLADDLSKAQMNV